MSSIIHKVKDAMRGDESDNRSGNNVHRTHSRPQSHYADDDDYGTSTVTTTNTNTNVTRSRTPAHDDDYEPNNAITSNRYSGAGMNTSPTATHTSANTFANARSEPPPLPGREPPIVSARRNNDVYTSPTSGPLGHVPFGASTGAPVSHVGTSGDRIGEAITGKPSVPHTGTYNHTSDNRGLVDRSKLMDPASKDAASNAMGGPVVSDPATVDTHNNSVGHTRNTSAFSPTTSRFDDNNKHGSIHDLRKNHDDTGIFGTGKTHDNDYNNRHNTLGNHEHGTGLTAQQRDNREANIAGATGAAGLATATGLGANSSIHRRAVGTGNNTRDGFGNSTDTYEDPAVRTHLNSTSQGQPQGGIHNGVIGHGSGRDHDHTGTHGLGRTTGTYDSKIPGIVPAVGPAPKAANDERFDHDSRFGNNDSTLGNNSRHGTGLGDNRSGFNDSRYDDNSRFGPGDSRQNNFGVDGVGFRSNNNKNDGFGRNSNNFGRDDDNYNSRNQNTFGRNENNSSRNQGGVFDRDNDNNNNNRNQGGLFNRDNDNSNNRNRGGFFNRDNDNSNNRNQGGFFNRDNDYGRNGNYDDNYNRNNNYGRNNDTFSRNNNNDNDNYNNRYNNSGQNRFNTPQRSGTGQLVTGLFGNPDSGLDHHGPGYNGSKVMHECENCGRDNDITHYFRKQAVYRLHRS